MDDERLGRLVEQYEEFSFQIHKKGEYLVNQKISEQLTYDQHFALRYIQKKGVCTSTELTHVFNIKKSAVTALINRLEEKELIRRERQKIDRRVVHLTLTNKGEALYRECNEKIKEFVAPLIQQFDEEEITTFMNTYEKLARLLDKTIVSIEGKNT